LENFLGTGKRGLVAAKNAFWQIDVDSLEPDAITTFGKLLWLAL